MSIASMTRVTPCRITRPTVSSDSSQTRSYTTVFRGWCRIQPLSAAEIERQGREMGIVVAIAYFEGVVDARSDDTLTLSQGGETYQIRGVRDIDKLGRLTTMELGRETGGLV